MKKLLLMMLFTVILQILFSISTISKIEESENGIKLAFNSRDIECKFINGKPEFLNSHFFDQINFNNYELPVFNTFIQVPNNHKAEVRLINPVFHTIKGIDLIKVDEDIIVNDYWIYLSDPFIMRNNLLTALSVNPFKYNETESSLTILIEAEIYVDFLPDSRFTISKQIPISKDLKNWLSEAVINYNDNNRIGIATSSLLIIYNQTASPLDVIIPLINWKRQMGWVVNAVSTSVTGSTTSLIKNYIQNAYNNWVNPPEYILIIGRATQTNTVATYTEYYNYSTVGDYKYTLLEGNDIIPDAYIGRLTFSSTDQLTSMINKIIAYEKREGLSANNWYNSALLVADETQSGPATYTCMDYIRNLMLDYNSNTQINLVNAPTFTTQIYSSLNMGVSSFYYRGFNGYSGMTNTDIANLINYGKYPFLSIITCFSGNFGLQSQLSIAEQFMRVGTASLPTGSIGSIGSSCETHTCLNNIMTGSIAYGFYKENLTNQGQALLRAKLGLLACYPQYPHDYIPKNFQSLNLIGDPTVDILIRQPTNIVVQHSYNTNANNGSINVLVTDTESNPVENAKLCLLKGNDELFIVGYTNSNGVFVFSWENTTAGIAILTVTKPNHMTYQANIELNDTPVPFTLTNTNVFNQLFSGKEYSFPITLRNNIYPYLNNVSATFISESQFVTISQGELTFSDVVINQTSTSLQNITLSISKFCPQNIDIPFSLRIQALNGIEQVSYTIYFRANENGPNIQMTEYQINTGDFLPGSLNSLTIKLKNIGSTTANNISAHLQCFNPNVYVTQQTQFYNYLYSGYSGVNASPFIVQINQNVTHGSPLVFFLDVEYNEGASQQHQFTIMAGSPTASSMTGPDEYGYICVADTDNHPAAKPYSWIEINPNLGGSGTILNLIDNDSNGSGSYQNIDIPFTFRFYGVDYNQITICSNGFIMPGNTGSQEWMNWAIPGPMVPRPIIAPFWDDLIISSNSAIVYHNFQDEGMFVVEWSGLRNKYNTGYQETFQVILYYQNVNPSPTSDNSFLYQYKVFNNIDAGTYGTPIIHHGQYASVGIADHTGLVGLQYTYQNLYPPSATTITNNSTLFFTTTQNQNFAPNPIIDNYIFLESIPIFINNQIDCGETIQLKPYIINTGAVILEQSVLTLSTNDDFVTILDGTSYLSNIEPYEIKCSNSWFEFSIAADVPNLHEVLFNIAVSSADNTYNLELRIVVNAPAITFSEIYNDEGVILYLEPQSINNVSIKISNLSTIDVDNAVLTFVNTAEWVINPAQISFTLPSHGDIELDFTLTVTDSASVGNLINILGDLYLHALFIFSFNDHFVVGNLSTIYEQDFNDISGLDGWFLSPGISVVPASIINDSGNEVVLTSSPQYSIYQIITPLLPAYDCQYIELSFKYYNPSSETFNRLYISFDNNSTWYFVSDFSDHFINTIESFGYISSIPENTKHIRFKWQFEVLSNHRDLIVFDDLIVKAVHHPMGYVSGLVTVDMHPENLSQIRIFSNVYPSNFVNPAPDGTYLLPLLQGTYGYLRAEAQGYLPVTINNLNIVSGQNTDTDLNLEYLRKPVNLSYVLNEGIVNLNWDVESFDNNNETRILPSYYKIKIIHNIITINDSTSSQTYQFNIGPSVYHIFVQSAYHDQNNDVYYSMISDELMINNTQNADHILQPYVFSLQQNYPNPFNPKTMISYSLKTKSHTKLEVYNVKGETIIQLLNQEQDAGQYVIEFDGYDNKRKPLPSGVYFYKLTSSNQSITKKMILLK